MKRFPLLLGLLILCVVPLMMIYGCSFDPAAAKDTSERLNAATTQAASMEAQIDAALVKLRATTQPTATMPTISPETIKNEAKAEKVLVATKEGLAEARKYGEAATPVIIAIANGDDPGPAITTAAPAFGPLAPYVMLGGLATSIVYSLLKRADAQKNLDKANDATASLEKANAAAQANLDALNAAFADGHLGVLTSRDAATSKVDSVVLAHPIGDRLVDAIAAAPVATPAK